MGMGHALVAAGVDTGATMDEALGEGGAYSGDHDVVALHLV